MQANSSSNVHGFLGNLTTGGGGGEHGGRTNDDGEDDDFLGTDTFFTGNGSGRSGELSDDDDDGAGDSTTFSSSSSLSSLSSLSDDDDDSMVRITGFFVGATISSSSSSLNERVMRCWGEENRPPAELTGRLILDGWFHDDDGTLVGRIEVGATERKESMTDCCGVRGPVFMAEGLGGTVTQRRGEI